MTKLWEKTHKRCEYNHAPFTTPNTNSQASITKIGHKLPERQLSLSMNARFRGYAHVRDPFTTPNTNSQASITKMGHKLPERQLSLSTNARFAGYAHVGDAVPHTHSKHINFQQHDVANQATINKYQTSIQNHHNSS